MSKVTAVAKVTPGPAIVAPSLKTVEIRENLLALRDEAGIAEGIAERAVVNNEDTLGRAADVVKSIGTVLKDTDDKRKDFTKPLRDAEAAINGLYKVLVTRLAAAKAKLEGKIGTFQREEHARRQAELDRQREADERNAAALAEQHREIGDDAGADDILEAAAALPTVAAPVRAVGMYGAGVSSQPRYEVEIVDRRKFLYELSLRKETVIEAVLADMSFGQRSLTALAKAVESEDILPVNGFEFTVFNKPIVR